MATCGDVTTVYVLRAGCGVLTGTLFARAPVTGVYADRDEAVDEGLRLLAEFPELNWYAVTAATRRRAAREVRVEVVS